MRLHFCRITDWEGVPQSREGQTFLWFESLKQAQTEKLLPMCSLVIERLMLPDRVALVKTPLSDVTEADFKGSGAKAILASSFMPEKEALAKRLGVPMIVCQQWFEHPEDVMATELPGVVGGSVGADGRRRSYSEDRRTTATFVCCRPRNGRGRRTFDATGRARRLRCHLRKE